MKKNLSLQAKIVIGIVVAAVGLLAAWFLLYMPVLREHAFLKDRLSQLDSQIKQIEGSFEEGKTFAEQMQILNALYRKLDSKFPAREEEGLKLFSDLARQFKVEVVSMKSQPKAVVIGEDSEDVSIDGKTCQKYLVSVDLKCRYAELVKLVTALDETLPVFVVVERLKIDKNASMAPQLNVKMELNFYLLS